LKLSSLNPDPSIYGAQIIPNVQSDRWSDWNPSAGFEWEINDSSTVSFRYAEAFKPGGFPLGVDPNFDEAFQQPYDAEQSKNFELTSKNEFFDNRVRFNLTFFWTDYDPFQICQLAGPLYFCESDGEATSRGIEIEYFATPVDGLDINGHFNYLDARIDRFQIIDPTLRTDAGGVDPVPKPVDVSGNRLPKAPEWSGSFGIQYTFDLGRYGQLVPRAQTQFQARTFFRVFNREEFSQDPFAKLDVRLTWRSESGALFAELFGANVTDVDVINFEFVGSQFVGGPVFAAYQPPRTWGFRVGATY
jgi:iron complex outermembrane receptor protein